MKKIAFLIFVILLTIKVNASQTEPIDYAATVNKFRVFYNSDLPDSIYSMFGPEMKNALTFDDFKSTTTQLKIQFGDIKQTEFSSYIKPVAVYKTSFQSSVLSLSVSLNAKNQIAGLLLSPYQAPVAANAPSGKPVDASVVESPIVYKGLSGSIHGTLAIPASATGKVPVVLIIADAGPVDRNGYSEKLGLNDNTYKLLAEGLGKSGIASVRFDKRMVGESTTVNKLADLRFEDYAEDAQGLLNMLNDDQRFSKVVVLGHGEGSLVGMLAVHDEPAKGFITVAGTSLQGDKFLTEQLKSKSQFIQDGFKTLLDSMRKGKTIDNIDPALYFVASPPKQRYLMSYCKYQPLRTIKLVKTPILIIQGTTDLSVNVDDANKFKKAKSDATLVIIKDMNHILKEAPADKDKNMETYDKPDLPLKPELVPAIVDFVNKL